MAKTKLFNRVKVWLELQNVKLDIFEKVLLAAPIFIWFSFYPVIRLGQSSTMNLELSLTLIYLVILAVSGLAIIWRDRKKLVINRSVWLVSVFVGWQFLSLFWAENLARGILTFGISILLFAIFLSCLAASKNLKQIYPALVKILITSAVIICIFALIQMIAGIWLGRSETLLCAGCVAEQFGFVRPNAFAIEPQFLGSLLLAPLLILQHIILTKNSNWRHNILFGFLLLTLILTLSRGAIFAFLLGALILFILNWREYKKVLKNVGVMILSVALALIIQGVATVANPNFDESFSKVIARSVHQLSLGVIDFRAQNEVVVTDQMEETAGADQPAFDGYVAESTDVRVNLSKVALGTWAQSPQNVLFGVGIGGAGVAMADYSDGQSPREIVQNEFVEVLLERGVIGAGLFAMILIGLFYKTRRQKWTWAIIAAFLLQWNFFSGYPNALHIYLILILLFVYAESFISRRGPIKSAQKS